MLLSLSVRLVVFELACNAGCQPKRRESLLTAATEVHRREGYRLRLYVPFGEAWYPYYMRRMAERPANVLFILRNLFRQ